VYFIDGDSSDKTSKPSKMSICQIYVRKFKTYGVVFLILQMSVVKSVFKVSTFTCLIRRVLISTACLRLGNAKLIVQCHL